MSGTIIVIGGPTAVGKTSLAIELAKWLNTEIISADSRQCYRQMTIGTAKPTPEELAAVPHHFIDSHDITEVFSAGDFSREARAVLNNLFLTHEYVIVTGGSGLYLNAFLYGISDIPAIQPEIRDQLNSRFQNEGLEPLEMELRRVDPKYSSDADLQNPQRVIRALEVYYGTGQPFSSFKDSAQSGQITNRIVSIGLEEDRETLYQRIDQRVLQMVREGLFDEARNLYEYREHYALKTVGYKEVFDFMEGRLSHDAAVEAIQRNTRRYAKRQMTWFRKYGHMTWFNPADRAKIKAYVTNVTGLS